MLSALFHSPRSPAPLLVLLTLLASLAPAARAGQIDVVVQEDDGNKMARLMVSLVQDNAGPFAPPLHVVTNRSGLARFSGLTPATYRVVFPKLPEPFLAPKLDPYQTPAVVTLRGAEETIELPLVLRRGIPIEVTALINGTPDIAGKVLFRHRASGREIIGRPRQISGVPLVRQLLVPGLWEVHLTPNPGLLLVGLDHDTSPLAGHQAVLDLAVDPFPTDLIWHFVAPCRIEGSVSTTGGEPTQVRMVATLVEPGPWIDAARRRGGSNFEEVTTGVQRNGFYEMLLPDGVWRVAPTSPVLESSSPPAVDLRLGPDETGNADFHVMLGDNRRPADSIMIVHVNNNRRLASGQRRPSHAQTRGALVEIYQDDQGVISPEPVATKKATKNWTRFLGLDKGDYLVAAHHIDFLEASETVPNFTARPTEARHVRLELTLGGQYRFEAFDVEGEPLPGVDVTVTRRGEPPSLVTEDPDFVAAKTRRRATTDRSGRAHMSGFYPGVYRVSASMPGQDSRAGLLDLTQASAPDEPLGPEVEVAIRDTETVEVNIHQRPSADLRMTLVCSDGWALPEAVAVTVFDSNKVLTDQPFMEQANIPLGGRLRDVLSVGPLPVGVYRLAIQPVGFDRATWAFGVYEDALAQEIQVAPSGREASEVLDLGEFDLECGPAVDIVPEAIPSLSLPDLRDVEIGVRLFDPDKDKHELGGHLSVSARPERFEIRNLPRGRIRVSFTLSHPHFLPTPDLHWEMDVDLERGTFTEAAPYFEQLGGAIQIKAPDLADRGGLARLISDEEIETETALVDGNALLPSLIPGIYEVLLCADASAEDTCESALGRWIEVTVTAGKTAVLSTAE